VAGDRRRTQGGGEIAHGVSARLAFGSGGRRDEAHRPLHGGNVRVALAFVGGEHRDQSELLGFERLSPGGRRGRIQAHLTGQAQLAATHAQRFDFAQRGDRIAPGPEHDADFHFA